MTKSDRTKVPSSIEMLKAIVRETHFSGEGAPVTAYRENVLRRFQDAREKGGYLISLPGAQRQLDRAINSGAVVAPSRNTLALTALGDTLLLAYADKGGL